MQTLSDVRAMLEARGLSPQHAFGQNFLVDQNLLTKLVDAARVSAGDTVLEVGPGTGVLTEVLLERGARVVACEIDRGLFELLHERLGGLHASRLTLHLGDCIGDGKRLDSEVEDSLGDGAFKLVANLPYGAATPLLLDLAMRVPRCELMAVTVQKEAAERYRAKVGTKEYGIASVLLGATMEMERVATLPPTCFWPQPKVTSEMLLLTRRASPLTGDLFSLRAVLERAFGMRRKQLGTSFGRDFPFPEDVPAKARPESVDVTRFVKLGELARRANLVREPEGWIDK